MNVTLNSTDKVNATLTVVVSKEDYQSKVDSSLKNFKKKANVPGFRPGHVPMGLINKMYGKSVLAEEVNKLVGDSLYNYIQENKLNVLGEPLPSLNQPAIDFAQSEEFSFVFDIALAPEVEFSLSKEDNITYYTVDVDDELLNKQIQAYRQNFGTYEAVDEPAKDTDLIKGTIVALNEDGTAPAENGIRVENGVLMPSYIKDQEEQAKFVGAKVGEQVVFNPGKAYEGNNAEIASLLKIEKDKIGVLPSLFSFQIEEVTRYKEADLNEDLFKKVFAQEEISSEEAFREKVRTVIQSQFESSSDYLFLLDARTLLENKVGKLTFPEATLKRWLQSSNKEKTAEEIDNEFPAIEKDLTFHLIKEKISKDFDIKVEDADIQEVAKMAAREQFARYNLAGMPEEMINNYAQEMLKNRDTVRNIVDKAVENKILLVLKEHLNVEHKVVALNEFEKLLEAHQATK